LLDAQLTHCIGRNDLCDSLQLRTGPLSTIRGAAPPSRNGLAHANRERSPEMAEKLFWRILDHLTQQTPGFAAGKRRGPAFRFKMPIHVIDSTTMELVANCLDWAKHRRRKAAAKTHPWKNKTTGGVPAKPTKIPKHDSAQKRHNPLKINGPSPRLSRYEMAVP